MQPPHEIVPPLTRRATWFPRPAWRDVGLALLLLLATSVAYFPALRGEFLLDDDAHVTRAELRSLAGLARIWSDIGATQQYYPVLHTAFWLEHRMWGDAVFGYHFANVALHLLAALLVVPLMRELRLPGGWLAAFLFALHPLAVESVAWISEQKNTLSAVGALASALAYLRFIRTRRRRDYAFATGWFLFALLSKTASATLPVVLAVFLWWRQERLDWRCDVAPLVPWLAAAAVAGLITLRVEARLLLGINADVTLSWLERVIVAGRAVWFYAAEVIWPANLTFLHERWPIDPTARWQYVFPLAVIAFTLALVARGRARRGPLAAWLVFIVTLLPVLGFVDIEWFVFAYVADHFGYLGSLAFIVPFAAWLAPLADRSAMRIALTAGLAAFGVLTWRHAGVFHDSITLYTHAVAHSPGSVVAHHHLGVALAADPLRHADAKAEFTAALWLNSQAAEAHEGLGRLRLTERDGFDEGVAHLEAALHLKPGLRSARTALAAAWFDRAKALAAEPDLAAAVIAAYGNALRFDPDFAEAHYNLANLLLRDPARLVDAIAHYAAAVRLKPDFAEAHTNLGVALARQPGRLDEAIAHFEAALRAKPDFAPARNNLENAQRRRASGVSPQR